MEGRFDDYRWAGPYIASRQVVAVNENSDIYNLAVQFTTKPEGIFLNRMDERIPKLENLISLGHRELIYTLEEMRQDGISLKIIEKYLDDPQKYLEVDDLGY